MKKNLLLGLAGLALLGFVLAKAGWSAIVPQSRVVWMGLPAILCISALRLVLQTMSWQTALRTEGIEASNTDLVGIRLAAQGTGYISVFGPAISEPLKIKLLGAETRTTTVATLVDTGAYWFTSGVFGTAASILAGLLVARSAQGVALTVSLGILFLAGLYLISRPKPLLPPILRAIGGRAPAFVRKGEDVETAIRGFAARHPQAMRRMLGLDFACQALLALEVIAVFWILGIRFDLGKVLALEAANRGVKILTGWMPARIGADEGGTAGAFVALGLPSASGLTLALTRRTRDLLACAAGFCWLTCNTNFRNTTTRNTPKEA